MNPTNHLHVICHMITTIDGKITGANNTDIFDDYYFKFYTKTEDLLGEKQGWLIGRVTMQMFASKDSSALPAATSDILLEDNVASHKWNKFMFGVDTRGLLRFTTNEIKLSNISDPLHLVIVVTNNIPKEYLSYLKSKAISYIFAGKSDINFESLLKKIKEKFGVATLLLEGGGLLNGALMKSDLIDEISIVLTPIVINQSEAPSLFENSISNGLELKLFDLVSFEKIDDNTLWLRYKNK